MRCFRCHQLGHRRSECPEQLRRPRMQWVVKAKPPKTVIQSTIPTLWDRWNASQPKKPGLEQVITEDGILCLIISFLPLREAVRTSVLSRRWRYIWTHIPKLSFNVANIFHARHLQDLALIAVDEAYEHLMQKADQFIRSVNSVLKHHQGLTRVDELEVRYFLNGNHSDHLNEWVRFAVAAKTKVLDFYVISMNLVFDVDTYYFPFELLGSSAIEDLSLAYCSFDPPEEFDGLDHLTKLTLHAVDATDQDIGRLLRNCPYLMELVMWNYEGESLCISHPLSELSSLIVRDCDYLSVIEMNAKELVFLEYEGVPVAFKLKQSSYLDVATISFKTEASLHSLDFYLTRLASNLPHLQSLKFKISGALPEVTELPKVSKSFNHVKCFNCKWNVGVKMSLIDLATVLNVAPILNVLKLHFMSKVVEKPSETLNNQKVMLTIRPHVHLKTIKITGFCFDEWQTEIVLHLLKVAKELESLTIEKGHEPLTEILETDIENLRLQVPANVKFVIL